MSGETGSSQEKKMNEQVDTEATELDAETLDKIKHPPAIDDVLRQLSPEELMGNQAVVPEMINETDNLRDDLKRD